MTALGGDLGRYQLLEPIGPAGGYGVPWSAIGADGKRYVVKLIPGFLDPSPDEIERLEIMLARLALVQSDHVVPIVDAGISDQTAGRLPWIAMPEMPGARSLRDELARSAARADVTWARQVLRDIALGLDALHSVGALHRDLKPATSSSTATDAPG
jgi:serine/threonine protein kinase